MNILIDWLSISVKMSQIYSTGKGMKDAGVGLSTWDVRERKLYNLISNAPDLREGTGRAPFKRSFHSSIQGFTYFESDNLPYCLIEFSGRGCDILRQKGVLSDVLKDWQADFTRIDIACDMETTTTPSQFAELRDHSRFRSQSSFLSETGETYYVGSRSSDRYARVYRYNPPHPRSRLLRCEMVLKGSNAQAVAKRLGDADLITVASELGKSFGWASSSWVPVADTGRFEAVLPERRQGGTERWLLTQVLSACRKMVQAGNRESIIYFRDQLSALLDE